MREMERNMPRCRKQERTWLQAEVQARWEGRQCLPSATLPCRQRAEAKGMRQPRERRPSAAAKNRKALLRKVHPATAAGHGLGSCPEQAARRHMPGGQQLRSTLEGPARGERRSSAAAQPRERDGRHDAPLTPPSCRSCSRRALRECGAESCSRPADKPGECGGPINQCGAERREHGELARMLAKPLTASTLAGPGTARWTHHGRRMPRATGVGA